jgi:hypothetical protein
MVYLSTDTVNIILIILYVYFLLFWFLFSLSLAYELGHQYLDWLVHVLEYSICKSSTISCFLQSIAKLLNLLYFTPSYIFLLASINDFNLWLLIPTLLLIVATELFVFLHFCFFKLVFGDSLPF